MQKSPPGWQGVLLAACATPAEEEDIPVHGGVFDHVSLLRNFEGNKQLKKEEKKKLSEVGKSQQADDIEAQEPSEISGSSRFLSEDSFSEFYANSVSSTNTEGESISRNTSIAGSSELSSLVIASK